MKSWSPMDVVFAIVVCCMAGWGLFIFAKAITGAIARAWFAEKERHAKRIIKLARGDEE